MGYLTFFINRIALEADTSAAMDFYNSEEHAGTSYLPFVGFMLFLAGIVVIIVGLATYLTAKHNFNIFFDARDVRMTYEEQIMPDDEKARLNNEKLAKDKNYNRNRFSYSFIRCIIIICRIKTPSAGVADGERGRRAVY